jgi:hypothetical protein
MSIRSFRASAYDRTARASPRINALHGWVKDRHSTIFPSGRSVEALRKTNPPFPKSSLPFLCVKGIQHQATTNDKSKHTNQLKSQPATKHALILEARMAFPSTPWQNAKMCLSVSELVYATQYFHLHKPCATRFPCTHQANILKIGRKFETFLTS